MAAQIIHAAGETGGNVSRGTHAVALSARDEAHLESIEAELVARGIRHIAIREPDAPWHGALMAIGIYPAPREIVGKGVSRLPLIK